MKFLLTTILFLSACAQSNSLTEKQSFHTHKLKKPLTVIFKSKDKVFVKVDSSSIFDVNLQIFHQQGESKTLLFDGTVTESSNKVNFELDDSLEASGGILAAIVKATDSNNKSVSSVATYMLGEQEEIDAVKKLILEN